MQYAVILKSGNKEIIEGVYDDRSTAGERARRLEQYCDVEARVKPKLNEGAK